MSTSADEPCAICDKPGKLRCGACKAIVFCSVMCQRIASSTLSGLRLPVRAS